ncbi:MAG: transposase [Flavobacteriaceae bacterium]|nr:MAG: transposase [Flavobacteriaceae bacterium]
MANTYTQIYFHVVFAVKGRACLIDRSWKIELYKYITGVITKKNQKLMIVNGMPDHIHLLIGTKPNCNLSDLVRDIKANSSKWINKKGYAKRPFKWQNGFGAFSKGQSEIPVIVNYIKNQEAHHAKKTFNTEYREILDTYEIDYDAKYLFDDAE